VHIFYLIGFRNRFIVMAEWAWLYLWNERGARDSSPEMSNCGSIRGRREHQQVNHKEAIRRNESEGGCNSVTSRKRTTMAITA
jgi:hypothetical protein